MKRAPHLPRITRAIRGGLASGLLVSAIGSTGLVACSDERLGAEPAPDPTLPGGAGASGGAGGNPAAGGTGGVGGQGGSGGAEVVALEDLLERLRADRDGTLLEESKKSGWPVPTDEGWVVVSTESDRTTVTGDFDAWTGTALTPDAGFAWAALPLDAGDRYKLTDGVDYRADPWSRSYDYDEFGELSLLASPAAHLNRHFITGTALADRTVRVWIPAGPVTRVLYVHDGQNLFDPEAMWGGWKLQTSAPAGVLVVGIDNSAARIDEYTHVPDDIGAGQVVGGDADAYADYLQTEVRPLVAAHYGEPSIAGVMGSSLGGLASLHVAARHPGEYAFAASLSGTLGWGKIGQLDNETMIERYAAAGHGRAAIYVDSGGGGPCVDADGDGVDDDAPDAADNYCETLQMRDTLVGAGYAFDVDLWHWHEPGAPHNEAAWAARATRPLDIFSAL